MIYLDNAATSWPKFPGVLSTMEDFARKSAGNPGRGGHALSLTASRLLWHVREQLATFFEAPDPEHLLFTMNATQALNQVIFGMLARPVYKSETVHAVTTSFEHNAVMRPLRHLERHGLEITQVAADPAGRIDMKTVIAAFQKHTRLMVINHASNVTGTVLPVREMAEVAHQNHVPVLVDCSQTAGVLPTGLDTLGVDMIAFTGHKGLYGPTGTGGLVLSGEINPLVMTPLIHGGTGSNSQHEIMPDQLPDRFEGGTQNTLGIVGLGAALQELASIGVSTVHEHEQKLRQRLIEGLSVLSEITLYGSEADLEHTGPFSLTVSGQDPMDVALALEEDAEILSRVGLHCAPGAHLTIGTWPEGTIRLSPGWFTTDDEIEETLRAFRRVLR